MGAVSSNRPPEPRLSRREKTPSSAIRRWEVCAAILAGACNSQTTAPSASVTPGDTDRRAAVRHRWRHADSCGRGGDGCGVRIDREHEGRRCWIGRQRVRDARSARRLDHPLLAREDHVRERSDRRVSGLTLYDWTSGGDSGAGDRAARHRDARAPPADLVDTQCDRDRTRRF